MKDAAEILDEMANTFRERNKVYGDNYKRVGEVMMAMFPNGIALRTAEDFNRWHLFELQIVKLTRFANSGLVHKDSIHDEAVYGAMVESLIGEQTAPITFENKQPLLVDLNKPLINVVVARLIRKIGEYAFIKGMEWRLGEGCELMDAYQALMEYLGENPSCDGEIKLDEKEFLK